MEINDIKKEIRKVLKEVVSTDFKNDGHGGIDSQTGNDLMGYYHSESGPLHQGSQPGDYGKHIYFNPSSGGGGSEKPSAEGESSGENIEENTNKNEEIYFYGLLDKIYAYQKIAKDAGLDSIHKSLLDKGVEILKLGQNGKTEKFNIELKSGTFEGKNIKLVLKGKVNLYYGIVDFVNFVVEIYLDNKLIEVLDNTSSDLDDIKLKFEPTGKEIYDKAKI